VIISTLEIIFVHFVQKNILGYFLCLQMIEYCRLKIEYLRFACGGSIFNFQSSIPACAG
jgi:hypothetical protein